MKRLTIAVSLASLAVASAAAAQTPYAPKKQAPSALIRPATYDRVPIRLKDWEVVQTRSVVNGQRLDFEQSYDVPYWDLVDYFEDAFKHQKPVSVLDPQMFPNARNPELRVYGTAKKGDRTLFTLGHPDLPYRFQLEVYSDDQSKAVVVIQNAVFSALYSGTMPARAPSKPAGNAEPVPFRFD